MRRFSRSVLGLAAAALLTITIVGCGRGPATDPSGKSSSPDAPGKTDVVAKPDASQIPASVRTEAFEYLGLGTTAALTYRVVRMVGDTASEGTVTSELVKTGSDSAVFRQRREGSLDFLGTDELEAKPDGVYQVTNSLLPLGEPTLMTPAKLAVGTVWDTTVKLAQNPQGITEMKIRSKVEKSEKITTPAGDFDTILIVSTTTIKVGGKDMTSAAKSWYAKGVGIVRLSSEAKDATGRDVKSTLELVKKE